MGKAKVNTKGVVGSLFQTCPVLDRNQQHAAFPNLLNEIWDVVNGPIIPLLLRFPVTSRDL